uniref:Uncharacterized protein n=1 Tax=Meloidogyne floridensis TaxID=298350 RepID=A0A915NFR0_9BILA
IRKKYLNGILIGENNDSFEVDDTSRLHSALSQGSNSSCSRISNQQQQTPNLIVNKLADLYEEHPPNVSCSSSSSSIGTGSQRSWVRQQPQQQTSNLINFAQLLPQYKQIEEEEEHKE